jgi:hypothetical protein
MTNRILLSLALALPLTGITGCAAMSNLFSGPDENGLTRVDSLLNEVERMHVESVLSRERMKDALVSLRNIVSPDFQGDALTSFALFVDAVDRSEEQQRHLDDSVDPMRDSADDIFSAWTSNLESISSDSMRRHGQDRMVEARERYNAILEALVPAQAGYADFNSRLRDHALFLGHDYTATAVAELGQEVGDILSMARDLDVQFQACEDAASVYVMETALRGQEQLSRRQARSTPSSGLPDSTDSVASNNR